jgi:hypothetical protein
MVSVFYCKLQYCVPDTIGYCITLPYSMLFFFVFLFFCTMHNTLRSIRVKIICVLAKLVANKPRTKQLNLLKLFQDFKMYTILKQLQFFFSQYAVSIAGGNLRLSAIEQ